MTLLLSHPAATNWLSVVLQLSFPAAVALIMLILCRIFYQLKWPWATRMGEIGFFAALGVLFLWLTITVGAYFGRLGG